MTILRAHQLELVGGRLCLDFVNTAAWDAATCLYDHLTGYNDLVRWGRHAGILSAGRTIATPSASGSAEALAIARALRLTCRRLLVPDESAGPNDPALLAGFVRELAPSLRLALVDGALVHAGPDAPGAWFVLPVALSAIELATSDARHAVRRCGWLFLDRTRNRSRVWCSMRTCGNRAKARAHYARRLAGG